MADDVLDDEPKGGPLIVCVPALMVLQATWSNVVLVLVQANLPYHLILTIELHQHHHRLWHRFVSPCQQGLCV